MSNIERMKEKVASLKATAKELTLKDGSDLNEVKSIMNEIKETEERIEIARTIGDTTPVKSVQTEPWKDFGSVKATDIFTGGTADANYKAYVFGRYLLAQRGDQKSIKWLGENGHLKANNETTESAGGYLVPVITSPDLIYLRERFGVARANAKTYPMSGDTLLVPNQTGSSTVYHVGENTAITTSDFVIDQVLLQTVKLAALNPVSRELTEDSIVDYASMAARDFAVKLAQQEDVDCFIGDGTATYGGITGILQSIWKLDPVNVLANKQTIASAVLADAGSIAANKPTLANIRTMVGKIAWYPGLMPKFYCHRQFWYDCIAPLLDTLNGNTIGDIQNAYGTQPTLYGYPVVWTNVMPRNMSTIWNPVLLFGDLQLGTAFGDRRGVTIEVSRERGFIEDQILYKATERFAFKSFDVGNVATVASGNQRPGCLVILATQAT